MIRSRVYPAACRSSKHHRHLNSPAVITLGCVVDYLVEGARDEVDELKLDEKSLSDLERAAELADVFSEDEDVCIAPHLFAKRAADGLKVGLRWHSETS